MLPSSTNTTTLPVIALPVFLTASTIGLSDSCQEFKHFLLMKYTKCFTGTNLNKTTVTRCFTVLGFGRKNESDELIQAVAPLDSMSIRHAFLVTP